MKKYFVAGTDTDAGKTFVTCALLHALKLQGYNTIGLKPISAGCELLAGGEGLRNEDALKLQAAMTVDMPYDQVNPVALEPAVAPHIALAQAKRRVTVEQLAGYCQGSLCHSADIALIEGAGGWRVPLNSMETIADLAVEMQLPVILVVGMKLGCINHALLTAQAIRQDKVPLAGWVANVVDPDMSCLEENIETLEKRLPAPLLGTIPHLSDSADAASFFKLNFLLS